MITVARAKKRIGGLTPKQIQELTVARLMGEDTTPIGSGYAAEPSEDLVIQLLRGEGVAGEARDAVVAGCRESSGRLYAWLASATELDSAYWQHAMIRLCCVVDIASPDELEDCAESLLVMALEGNDVPPESQAAAVRASMGYRKAVDQVPFWEKLLDNRNVAAYAFNALLSIDPASPGIGRELKRLSRKQKEQGWSIDIAFLSRRAARAQHLICNTQPGSQLK